MGLRALIMVWVVVLAGAAAGARGDVAATGPAAPAGAAVVPGPAPATFEDPGGAIPLPPRRGTPATTRASGAAGVPPARSAPADPFDARRVGVALLVVVGLIFATQKVWKRMAVPGSGGRSAQSLQVISRLAVSPKHQALLLRVGRRCVLVGVSGGGMTTLSEITDPEEVAWLVGRTMAEREEPAAASFDTVLGGAEARFEEAGRSGGVTQSEAAGAAGEDEARAMARTREELNGMVERVRSLSKQFSGDGAR